MTPKSRTSFQPALRRKTHCRPAPHLSAEVLSNIFWQVGLELSEDSHAFKDNFHSFSLRLSFRVITLRPPKYLRDGCQYAAPENAYSGFARVVSTSSHIAGYIKHIDFMVPRRPSQARLAVSSTVSKALLKIHGLVRLDLRREESSNGPFALDDCSGMHGVPPNKAAGALGKDGVRKHSKFMDSILHLLAQVNELGLHKISLPSDILSSCTKLRFLDVMSANIYPTKGPSSLGRAFCPALTNLELDTHALVCLKELLNHSAGQKLLHLLSGLKNVTLIIQAVEDLSDNSPQQLVLSRLTSLTSLQLELYPANDTSSHPTPRISPLSHLNPTSFRTLTYFFWHTSFKLDNEDTLIRDPYRALFSGGVFSRLENFVDLIFQFTFVRQI